MKPARRSSAPAPILGLLLASCGALSPAPEAAAVVRGPLPSRNQHPVAMTFLHPRPRRAVTTPEGRWAVAAQGAYSSIFEEEAAPGQRVYFDGEVARAGVRLRRGLGARTDVEVEVAGLFASSGFLDGIVNDFHSLFGFPDQGREDAEDGQYRMLLRRDGAVIYELEEDRIGLGDLPVAVTHQVRVEDAEGPGVALRVGVELPTGSEEHGFGNGGVDWGAGVLAERSAGRWTFTGALDWTTNAQPEAWRDADVTAKDLAHVQAGAEYRWSDRLSLLAQLFWTSPMTRDYDVEEFNHEIMDLAVGCAWGSPGGPTWFAAFQEDLVAATGPDFGVLLGLAWGF